MTFDSNSASSPLPDNVYFTTSYVVLDSDDDNDASWTDTTTSIDPTEQDDNDEDGICDDQDLDDDNDGVFDFNDEFPTMEQRQLMMTVMEWRQRRHG